MGRKSDRLALTNGGRSGCVDAPDRLKPRSRLRTRPVAAERWLTVKEAAERFGVCTATCARDVSAGRRDTPTRPIGELDSILGG